MLSDIQVPVLIGSKKDETRWVDNNGKLVEFSIKNVRKDKIDEGLKVTWEKMVTKACICFMDGCSRKVANSRQSNEMENS